ncbi:hypothetical protein [Halococcus hamelinensis]|uniref:Right handed beta helix domain-containing protein n=1 Tax=Halococcus hamelinensis 100A6 TaxID=1132509 RepID=M0LWR3_9EURY|nr:hypothetical protein [Halococcus hamelinensis]EMA37916.1 hypothetical protein C447_10785 [Halococcus hamelinensis 100A6]
MEEQASEIELTKRGVLRAGLGIGAGSALSRPVAARPEPSPGPVAVTNDARPGSRKFESPGSPSRAAYRALAAVERQVTQRSGSSDFDRTVNAVEYLGLGSNDAVNEALERADAAGDLDGVRLRFPAGTYRVADDVNISPAGPFGIVGPRAVFRVDPGVRCELNVHTGSRGLFEGFTIDQRADRAAVSLLLETDDHIDARGLTFRGPVEAVGDDQQALVRPVATSREASVRIENLRAVGGTNAGSHAWVRPESPPPGHVAGGVPGAFVGESNVGVVQFVEPVLHGWENGLYASRTPGAVQVVGGTFVNNNNTAVRISGAESFCDGATVVLDAGRWPDGRPGRFTIGEIQGVSGVRSETGPLNKEGARFRNLDVRARRLDRCPGLVVYDGSAATGRMHNCRLTNDIDGTPAVRIDEPGTGPHPASTGPQAIRMDRIEIRGSATGGPAVSGTDARPNTVLADSCVRLPGAGPASIVGVTTRNVGYGADCTASQGTDGPVGAPPGTPEVRDLTVRPPSPDPGLSGLGLLVAAGALVSFGTATLVPALRDRLRK